MTLADLPDGATAPVTSVEWDEMACVHLMEAGFTPGQAVRVIAHAPLGCPMAFAVRGGALRWGWSLPGFPGPSDTGD